MFCVSRQLSCGFHLVKDLGEVGSQGLGTLLQLNNVADGFGDGRRFELFFESGVIGFEELSELGSDPDNKSEGSFNKKDNGGYLGKDIGSWCIKDSGFIEDFEIFFHGAVGPFCLRPGGPTPRREAGRIFLRVL